MISALPTRGQDLVEIVICDSAAADRDQDLSAGFAGGVALKSFGKLDKLVGPVDSRNDLTAFNQLSDLREIISVVRFPRKVADPRRPEPVGDGTRRSGAEEPCQGTGKVDISTIVIEDASKRERRSRCGDIEYHIESLASTSDVSGGVIDDPIGPDLAHKREFLGSIDADDLRSLGLGNLDGEVTDTPPGSIYQDGLALLDAPTAEGLQCQ
jgi:hypothetical protein